MNAFPFEHDLDTTLIIFQLHKRLMSVILLFCRLAGDQRARRDQRDVRNDSDAEDDDDVKKV